MKSRLMRHEGTARIVDPKVTSQYFDPVTETMQEEEISPETVHEFEVPPDTKYGDYPVRKDVLVPLNMQAALVRKGFKFLKAEDAAAYQTEQAAIEAKATKTEGGN